MCTRERARSLDRSGTARYALQVVADWYLLSLSEIMIGTPLARSVPAASVGLARRHGSVHRLVHVLLFVDGGVLALAGRHHVVDPDDWDETALPGGTCEALSWSVRSRARDMTQLIADVL